MAKKRKAPGVPGMGNSELHAAMVGKRLSSAASPHKDRRTKRARTRSAAERKAIRDME